MPATEKKSAPTRAKALAAKIEKKSEGDLAAISEALTATITALGKVRVRVADLRSEAQLADLADGQDNPHVYERAFQTLGAMDREVGNAEASIRNIIGVQRQLDQIAADLKRLAEPSS